MAAVLYAPFLERSVSVMVTHMVMWNFKESLTEEVKKQAASEMKEKLEALKELVPGVLSVKVVIHPLASSTRDIALIGEYEDEAALKTYAGHPEHVKVVETLIKKFCTDRTAFDF